MKKPLMTRLLFTIWAILITSTAISAAAIDSSEEISVIVVLKDEVELTLETNIIPDDPEADDQELIKQKVKKVEEEIIEDLESINVTHQFSVTPGFSASVNATALQELKEHPLVQDVYHDWVMYINLDQSIPAIQADKTWNLTYGGTNLSGEGETICIIDTGIDTDHPAFQNRIKDQHCYCSLTNSDGSLCCPDNTGEDTNAEDDQGHGTHVAGIASGDFPPYSGVAKKSNILPIKVCNENGACAVSDIIMAIDRCTANASRYNISVISISLGGGGPYNNYCAGDVLEPAIISAANQNISVVVSAGNNGFTNGISTPACIEAATPVGAVNGLSMVYNRGDILNLVAPGMSITSPYVGGSTASLSGTSMATPHVSGTIAILQQFYKKLFNQYLTPQQIETTLNNTGQVIDDLSSSGKYYSRIDVLAAIMSLDSISPVLTFSSPTPDNNTLQSQNSVLLNITSSEILQLTTLEWNGVNTSSNLTTYIIENLTHGNYTYRIFGKDLANNSNFTETRTLRVNLPPAITFNRPTNQSVHPGDFQLDIYIQDPDLVSEAEYLLFSSNFSQQYRTNILSSSFTFRDDINSLDSGSYTLTISAVDTIGFQTSKSISFMVDSAAPGVNMASPVNNSVHSDLLSVQILISDRNISNISYNVQNTSGIIKTDYLTVNDSTSVSSNFSINLSNYADGSYTINIIAKDSVSNTLTKTANFIVDTQKPSISSPTLSPDVIYNNVDAIVKTSVNDLNLNTSVILESNFSGSLNNYSMKTVNGVNYNLTIKSNNFSNHQNISYLIYARDLAGNSETSSSSFFITNRIPTNISIIGPIITEPGYLYSFNATALDYDQDQLNFSWLFEGNQKNGSQILLSPSILGNHNLQLTISDPYSSNSSSVNIFVNDTLPPRLTSLNYLSEVHLERDSSQQVSSIIVDGTSINNITLLFNETSQNGTCSLNGTSSTCSWTISLSSIGETNYSIFVSDNYSHQNLSTYTFSVTSCSDGSQNGDESGTDCGGSCAACATGSGGSGNSGGSSSSGGSGSSSSGGSSIQASGGVPQPQISNSLGVESRPPAQATEQPIEQSNTESNQEALANALGAAEQETSSSSLFTGAAIFSGIKTMSGSPTTWAIIGAATLLGGITFSFVRFRKRKSNAPIDLD